MKHVWMGLCLMALATPAQADQSPSVEVWPTFAELFRNSTYKPSTLALEALAREGGRFDMQAPAFVKAAPRLDVLPSYVKIQGEIAVLEGDSEIVSDLGEGNYGLRYDNQRQDPMRVSRRLLSELGDHYDFILVWTSFWDAGADGLAYYVPIRQRTKGIGQANFNTGRAWGSADKLEGMLNMKSIEVYGNVANSSNWVYPVVGQELTHRWLATFWLNDENGQRTRDLLGRDAAHWSSLLQAFGSVQDGNLWRDNEDGTFTVLENMTRYSPLDLYAMGIAGPEEVEPFYLIENALHNNQPVNPAATLPIGATVSGTRREITIEQIIASNGERLPVAAEERKEWRVAMVLVTRPGQTIDEVQHELSQIEQFRQNWVAKHYEWTGQRSTVCTRLLQDCNAPDIQVSGLEVFELVSDGDGIFERGEHLGMKVTISNQGREPSSEVTLSLNLPEGSPLVALGETTLTIPSLASQASTTLDLAFAVQVSEGSACEANTSVSIQASDDRQTRTITSEFEIGRRTIAYETLDNPSAWTFNPYGSDTATMGFWEIGRPSRVTADGYVAGLVTQPGADVDGDVRMLATGASRMGGLGGNDIDGGITTALSPVYDIKGSKDPWLSYHTWHAAYNFNAMDTDLFNDTNDYLSVEVSGDGGQTWVLVDYDISNTMAWESKLVRLREIFVRLPETIRLRFTARDMPPESLSEAAVDAIRIWEFEPTCEGAAFVPREVDDTDTDTDSETTDTDTDGWGFGGRIDSGCQTGSLSGLLLAGLGMVLMTRRRKHV